MLTPFSAKSSLSSFHRPQPPMAEFTYKSIGLLIDHLVTRSRIEIDHFLEGVLSEGDDLLLILETRSAQSSKLQMLRDIFKALMRRHDRMFLKNIVEQVLVELGERDWSKREGLERALRADGFIIHEGSLVEEDVPLERERTALE